MASAVAPDRDALPPSRREGPNRVVEWLCGGLLLFGAIRAAPLAAEFAGVRVEQSAYPAGIVPSRPPPLAEIEALTIFSLLWPPAIALGWWWTRRRGLARAAMVTFLALGCESLSALLAGGVSSIGVGKAQPSRFAAALAAVLAVLALMAAGLAWRSGRALGQDEGAARAADRKNIGARLMVLGSVVFAVSILAAECWSLYLKVMEQNPTLRDWALRSDRALRKMSVPDSPHDPRARVVGTMIRAGMEFTMTGRYLDAQGAYESALRELDALARADPDPRRYVLSRAIVANNLAWLLTTCPDTTVRDPARAVELAERAVTLLPGDANSWNTLGAAYYRAGDHDAAIEALGRSTKLSSGGNAVDWYLRAMIHARRGAKDEARDCYDRGQRWAKRHASRDGEIYRFQCEAAALLGLPPPPVPEPDFGRLGAPNVPYQQGPRPRPPSGAERRRRD